MNNPVDEVIKVCGMVQAGALGSMVATAALVSIGVPAAIAEQAVTESMERGKSAERA